MKNLNTMPLILALLLPVMALQVVIANEPKGWAADSVADRAAVPADFRVRDDAGRITRDCTGKKPLVMCMQGRKVVMQVLADRSRGFFYTAGFFNLQQDVLKKKPVIFEAGSETVPGVWVNERRIQLEFPSAVTFDGMLTLTYPVSEGMFGIVPTGLDAFECTPWLPKDWPRMALRDVRAFGRAWDWVVERGDDQQKVTVTGGGQTIMTGSGPAGKTYAVTFLKQEIDPPDHQSANPQGKQTHSINI